MLDAVAERATTTWDRARTREADTGELSEFVIRLAAAVGDHFATGVVRLAELPPYVPARRMLEAIRRCLLDDLEAGSSGVSAEDGLRLLSSVEAVQNTIDRDAAQRFATQFSGPDALELVVEVAHDMRSPLTSILFLVETLRRTVGAQSATQVQERQLGLVYSAAFGLSSMTNDVIELARGGDRLVDAAPHPFSLSETMHGVSDIVRPIAEEKGLALRIISPDAAQRLGQGVALTRVLLNLTTNALKFTNEGFVEIAARPRGHGRVQFSVRDTGRGMTPQVVQTLFEAFRRRERPGEYFFSSAGLGLTICRKLVQKMGGELTVETAPGVGTSFSFTLSLPVVGEIS